MSPTPRAREPGGGHGVLVLADSMRLCSFASRITRDLRSLNLILAMSCDELA